MNRIIKFRAWDKLKNKWRDDTILLERNGGLYVLDRDSYIENCDGEYEIVQFTGILDKNGKEIYEGDIVKILYTDWSSCSGCHSSPQEHMNAIALTRVVVWSVQGFYVSHKVDGYAESMEPGTHGFIEVIGNIYENPKLIK